MKVLVLGGYGVFGTRLSQLLIRDGHDVTVAGPRLQKAKALTQSIGGTPLKLRLPEDIGKISDAAPEAVIDASGPFQAYVDDPYQLAQVCIADGIDYLDLSDSAAFTNGITALDQAAREAGVRVISGASSVPGLSSTVVQSLAHDFDTIEVIETAILPGIARRVDAR